MPEFFWDVLENSSWMPWLHIISPASSYRQFKSKLSSYWKGKHINTFLNIHVWCNAINIAQYLNHEWCFYEIDVECIGFQFFRFGSEFRSIRQSFIYLFFYNLFLPFLHAISWCTKMSSSWNTYSTFRKMQETRQKLEGLIHKLEWQNHELGKTKRWWTENQILFNVEDDQHK